MTPRTPRATNSGYAEGDVAIDDEEYGIEPNDSTSDAGVEEDSDILHRFEHDDEVEGGNSDNGTDEDEDIIVDRSDRRKA